MQQLTCILDCFGDTPSILHFFLTWNTSAYFVQLFSTLCSSDQILISASCPIAPVRSIEPAKRWCFCHYSSVQWEELRMFSDFQWNEYCFQVQNASLSAHRIAEVIASGMEAYIPHTFSFPDANKNWFSHACFHVIKYTVCLQVLHEHWNSWKSCPHISLAWIVPYLYFNLPNLLHQQIMYKTL